MTSINGMIGSLHEIVSLHSKFSTCISNFFLNQKMIILRFQNFMFFRSVKKYSQAAINRKRKFEQVQAPKELRLHDFIHKKRVRSLPTVNLKVGKAVCSCMPLLYTFFLSLNEVVYLRPCICKVLKFFRFTGKLILLAIVYTVLF